MTTVSRKMPAMPTVPPGSERMDEAGLRAAHRVTLAVLARIVGTPPPGIVFRLWDGTCWPERPETPPLATIELCHPGALRRLFLPLSERALGESYLRGDYAVTGDLEATFQLRDRIDAVVRSPATALKVVQLLRQLPQTEPAGVPLPRRAGLRGLLHSRERDREAIQYHYDLSNEFYALWLDRRMIYSCAYFETGAEDLDAAQEAKLDLICRKLRLAPGERLLDVGSGWGGLLLHAAGRYGVEATGVTLSERQAALARQRIAAAGLAGRVRVILGDYRDLPRDRPFDKIASVGMFEHIGRARLPEYFRTVHALLKPGGLFLNHGIGSRLPVQHPVHRLLERAFADRGAFVQQYVFPDGDLVLLSDALGAAERVGWEVRDVESLREHYARTLRLWGERLARRQEEAERLVGQQTYRIWRLYLAGAAYGFAVGQNSVYQTLLAKPDATGSIRLPLTRADLYRRERGSVGAWERENVGLGVRPGCVTLPRSHAPVEPSEVE